VVTDYVGPRRTADSRAYLPPSFSPFHATQTSPLASPWVGFGLGAPGKLLDHAGVKIKLGEGGRVW
jgi:hypothetical protein